jgi:hypothetical protein
LRKSVFALRYLGASGLNVRTVADIPFMVRYRAMNGNILQEIQREAKLAIKGIAGLPLISQGPSIDASLANILPSFIRLRILTGM